MQDSTLIKLSLAGAFLTLFSGIYLLRSDRVMESIAENNDFQRVATRTIPLMNDRYFGEIESVEPLEVADNHVDEGAYSVKFRYRRESSQREEIGTLTVGDNYFEEFYRLAENGDIHPGQKIRWTGFMSPRPKDVYFETERGFRKAADFNNY